MAPMKRKRSHPRRSENNTEPPWKKNTPAEDDEILSDEAEGASDDDTGANAGKPDADIGDDEDEVAGELENETAEERRLRLARAYLKHIGVSEETASKSTEHVGALDAGDDDDDDDEDDEDNARLRMEALAESGKGTTPLADRLKSDGILDSPSSVTILRNRKEHVMAPTCVSIARENGTIAVSGGKDSRVVVWDIATGKAINNFKPSEWKKKAHKGVVNSVIASDDGQVVLSGGMDGVIRIWDVREGKETISLDDNDESEKKNNKTGSNSMLRGHRGAIRGLSLRGGGRQLFSASDDRQVKIWDMGQRAYVESLFGHGAEVNAVDSMLSERAVSCGRDGTVRLYKVEEGSQLVFRQASTMSIDAVSIVNEQRFVSGGDDGSVSLWHLNKKKPTATRQWAHGKGGDAQQWISSVCSFRNSDLAMSGAGDGAVRFWKCEDVPPKLNPLGEVNVGKGFVNGIAVSRRRNVMAVALGNEHRLGRWNKVAGAKNSIQFISLPLEGDP